MNNWFWIFVLWCSLVNAKTPPAQLRGTWDILKKEVRDLSPLNALIISETSFLSNHKKHPLIEKLFVQDQNGDFCTTSLGINPPSHFGAGHVAELLLSFKYKEENFKNRILDSNYEASLEAQDNIAKTHKDEFRKLEEKYEKDSLIRKETEEFNKKTILPLKKEITKLKKDPKNKDIVSEKQLILEKYESENKDKLKGLLSSQKLRDGKKRLEHALKSSNVRSQNFSDQLDEDLKFFSEEYQKDSKFFTQTLLVFLALKIDERKDLEAYFEKFKMRNLLKYNIDEDFLGNVEGPSRTLNLPKIPKLQRKVIRRNFEQALLSSLESPGDNQNFVSALPFSAITNLTSNGYKSVIYPNCGENSIRNLFNILFYNSQTDSVDSKIMDHLDLKGFKVNPKIREFYKKYPVNASGRVVHNEWNLVVSESPNVQYLYGSDHTFPTGRCNLKPAYQNIKVLLRNLLGSDDLGEIIDVVNEVRPNRLGLSERIPEDFNVGNIVIVDKNATYEWKLQLLHFTFKLIFRKSVQNKLTQSLKNYALRKYGRGPNDDLLEAIILLNPESYKNCKNDNINKFIVPYLKGEERE